MDLFIAALAYGVSLGIIIFVHNYQMDKKTKEITALEAKVEVLKEIIKGENK